MRQKKTNYELTSGQVATPHNIVDFYWEIVGQHRPKLGRVLDIGAGDARFSRGGSYDSYFGIEIDRNRAKLSNLPPNGELQIGCAFALTDHSFDACIGNPPYVRHHDVESPWKEDTLRALSTALDTRLDGHGNLFLYFIALGLIKTNANGLVALLVPFEWVSRPSAKGLRSVIDREKWAVSIYRFEKSIFEGVLTTASICVIDKSRRNGTWKFFDVSPSLKIKYRDESRGNSWQVIKHSGRGQVFSQRGLSPGTQTIFTLTEGERVHHGLHLSDVMPCVTSLRGLPIELRTLNKAAFRAHFVGEGRRCWLIKSNKKTLSSRLRTYLKGISVKSRTNYTCDHQDPWYNYEQENVPRILVHSGFVSHGPRTLVNAIGAVNVGSVYGVFAPRQVAIRKLQAHLLSLDIENSVVPHAKTLKKIEVGQLNTLLEEWWQKRPDC